MLREVYKSTGCKVVEQPPSCRTLRMLENTRDRIGCRYFLSLPYIQFYFSTYAYMTFSQQPLDVGVVTYFPLLPNVMNDGMICHQSGGIYRVDISPEEFVTNFWSSKFQLYAANHWQGQSFLTHCVLQSYANWHSLTRQDPAFILSCKFPLEHQPIPSIQENLKRRRKEKEAGKKKKT